MNYYPYEVTIGLQEIPNEISLIIPLAGCSHKCVYCHSPHYQDPNGGVRLLQDYPALLNKYASKATCICFFGGEHNPATLAHLLRKARARGFKTALYSGFEMERIPSYVLDNLDYVKTGAYKEEFGGLASMTTNQRMWERVEGSWANVTYRFWR